MPNYKNMKGATYIGPEYVNQRPIVDVYKEIFPEVTCGMCFTISIQWLIEYLKNPQLSPVENTVKMYSMPLDYFCDAALVYKKYFDEFTQGQEAFEYNFSLQTDLYVNELSNDEYEAVHNGGEETTSVDLALVGLQRDLLDSPAVIIGFSFNELDENGDMETYGHAVGLYHQYVNQNEDYYYFFDPNYGVNVINGQANLKLFLTDYWNLYGYGIISFRSAAIKKK